MPEQGGIVIATSVSINHHNTAVLCMDYRNDSVGAYADGRQRELLSRAAVVLSTAHRTQRSVIYVLVRFRNGYPEISPRNKLFRKPPASPRQIGCGRWDDRRKITEIPT
jgi:hypothetical protein